MKISFNHAQIKYLLVTFIIVASCSTLSKSSVGKIEEKSERIVLDNVSKEYIDSFLLYYDDGPYVSGPLFRVNSMCLKYTFEKVSHQAGVAIKDVYTYYIPLDNPKIIIRGNKFSGQGYHGGHLIILTEEGDSRYDDIAKRVFNGGTLVRTKDLDSRAKQFEAYCRQEGYIK